MQSHEKELPRASRRRLLRAGTVKVMCTAAVLARSASSELLPKLIPYTAKDLALYSPITTAHTRDGMSVAELRAVTLQ